MASEDDDDSQKTEEPSQRRIDQALEDGQIIQSKEINNLFLFAGLFALISFLVPSFIGSIISKFKYYLTEQLELAINNIDFYALFKKIIFDFLSILAIPLLIFILANFASYFLQQRTIRFSFKAIEPSLDKLSPMKGLKRIFSIKSVIELIKSLIKLIIIGIICYLVVQDKITIFAILYSYDLNIIFQFIAEILFKILMSICIIMFLFSGADYLYQYFEFYKKLRMSKQEQKDEYKETEGNPEIKSKRRSLMRELSQQNLAAQVPKSDVIITNPTHFAVCLKYDPATMQAPVVSAKGQDNMAFNIRKIANENNIPIISNPPLARSLFDEVKIGGEIPEKHYQAVAEIISYVFKQKNKKV